MSAKRYHDRTSYERYNMSGHHLDWGTQPKVFKTYPGLETVSLPSVTDWQQQDFSAVLETVQPETSGAPLDLAALTRILLLTETITAKARYGGTDFFFRSVASAGALYPCELYVAALEVTGLEPGLYHRTLVSGALTLLRSGKAAAEIVACVKQHGQELPSVGFFVTATYYRSSWKYRDRAYRYHLLDCGHLLENLTLALKALSIPFELFYDFPDSQVNALLGVDENREVCLAAVLAGDRISLSASEFPGETEPSINLAEASRVANREIEYPEIAAIHRLSCNISAPPESERPMTEALGLSCEPGRPIELSAELAESVPYPDVVFKRRSLRNFVPATLPADRFNTFLKMLCTDSADNGRRGPLAQTVIAVGFTASQVSGIDSGLYLLDRSRKTFALAHRRDLMDEVAHCCLGQEWLRNCGLHVLFLTNLDVLERTWGARGYRYALLEAGRLGQRLYLGATAMKLGCCGIGAFYDSEARRLFGLGDGAVLLYLVGVGPVRKMSGLW